MTNPIPTAVRGWLYVAGIVAGLLVATVLPDLLKALAVGDVWVDMAIRATGAVTLLLSTLSRANLSEAETE